MFLSFYACPGCVESGLGPMGSSMLLVVSATLLSQDSTKHSLVLTRPHT